MADSKKYDGNTWEHSLRKLTTSTDTFTTLPADIYAVGNNATVGLKGNTVQNGTPTPDNPIMPQGTGERTGNLFDYRKIVPGYTYDGTNGQMILNPDEANRWRFAAVPLIEVEPGATYLRTYNLSPWGNYINFYDSNKNFLEQVSPGSGVPVTVPSNCNFVSFVFQIGDFDAEKYMFTKGSTAPTHFEPYGYKIPISSASTTTPVYLGEVETTRQIRKSVLTGNENFSNQYGVNLFSVPIQPLGKMNFFNSYCTHYKYNPIQSGLDANTQNGDFVLQLQLTQSLLAFKDTSYSSVADFKSYLAQQYAAGTPVTVWYVLETEETGIVNEPLMKIGDYGDTVSGISIPTITGKDTFDVETTLKPSEASLSYAGWHDATVEEWDGSQWQ